MRRATSSDGFLIGYIISVMWNIGWGLLALILWALHYLLGLPLFFTFIALAVWLLKALVATSLVYWAASSAADPTPKRENRNPYSAKDGDLFGARKNPDTGGASAPAGHKEEEPHTPVADPWNELFDSLWEAASLIGVPRDVFMEVTRQAVSGARDPASDTAAEDRVSPEDMVYWFLDGLSEEGFIGYHNWNAQCLEIAVSLSESATLQGQPAIPDGLLEAHPMRQTESGEHEVLGGLATVHIASKVTDWRVFVISEHSDWFYAGAVSHENAEKFHTVMNHCCNLAASNNEVWLMEVRNCPVDHMEEKNGDGGRSELYDKLWEAASLIGVPKEFFTELMRQVLSGERDPDFNPENKERVSSEDVVYWFFEGLLEHRYLGYHDWNAPYAEIAASLSESASLQGLPEIPEAFLKQETETAGIGAMMSIASRMDEWCVFVIEDSSDWRMVGAVPRENAERFHAVINLCCELAGSGYKIGLLRKMDTLAEQTGETAYDAGANIEPGNPAS